MSQSSKDTESKHLRSFIQKKLSETLGQLDKVVCKYYRRVPYNWITIYPKVQKRDTFDYWDGEWRQSGLRDFFAQYNNCMTSINQPKPKRKKKKKKKGH